MTAPVPPVTTRSWVMTLQLSASGTDPETVTVRGTTVLAPSVTRRQAISLILGLLSRRTCAERPAYPCPDCPDHPASALVPFPGGGSRGTCPVDSRSHQMHPTEVTA